MQRAGADQAPRGPRPGVPPALAAMSRPAPPIQQVVALGAADLRAGDPGHAPDGGRDRGAVRAERPDAGNEALSAAVEVIPGGLQGDGAGRNEGPGLSAWRAVAKRRREGRPGVRPSGSGERVGVDAMGEPPAHLPCRLMPGGEPDRLEAEFVERTCAEFPIAAARPRPTPRTAEWTDRSAFDFIGSVAATDAGSGLSRSRSLAAASAAAPVFSSRGGVAVCEVDLH